MYKSSYTCLMYIFTCIGFTVVGQLLIKSGLQSIVLQDMINTNVSILVKALTCPKVILGLISALIAAAAWTIAISKCELSFAYPFMGLAIVLVLLLTPLVFHEHIPLSRWVGVGLVCIGLWVAAR